ncbi:MAG: CPBP family intramembrane metalloprotease [Oscillospiraceae bacterium]|nr:CPBP family intramembrane metalloprotease [Oscillospiraceae bacterium]
MIDLFKKKEDIFAIICIVIYVVGYSICDSVSESIGVPKLITLIFGIVLSAVLFGFAKKNDLMEYLGLCRVEKSGKELLWFIPVIIFTTTNLWTGVALNDTILVTVLSILSMFCVGFLEELIFRGLLFKAMSKTNMTSAIIVSSLTFGFGHIVNLLNGAEFFSTMIQIVYASTIGFCFVMIFCVGKSIVPCIISHALFNSFSIIRGERSEVAGIVILLVLIFLSAAYGVYLFRIFRRETKQA